MEDTGNICFDFEGRTEFIFNLYNLCIRTGKNLKNYYVCYHFFIAKQRSE